LIPQPEPARRISTRASSGRGTWRLIRRPRIKDSVDRRLFWFPGDEHARGITFEPPGGTHYMLPDPTVGDRRVIDQWLTMIPEVKLARRIIPECPAELGTRLKIRWCVAEGISHQRLGAIPLIKVARRIKRRSPAELDGRHMIQRPACKGRSDRRL